MVAAGLPQPLGRMGRAKSYTERLFEFVPVGALDEKVAADAIRLPIEREEEAVDELAVTATVRETAGYPYFLQEWGKHSWDAADASPISAADVEAAGATALAELDASFFRVRFDRLAPAEKRYLRAMAALGPGPHRSGDVAEWTPRGAHLLLQTRTRTLDGTLRSTFERWYPGLANDNADQTSVAA